MKLHRQPRVGQFRSGCAAALLLIAIGVGHIEQAAGEAFAASPESGQAIVSGQPASPEQMKAMREAQAKAAGAQPKQEAAKPGEGEKKQGEGDKKKEKEEASAETVKRPDKPPREPDPRELEVALDEQGRVPPFNFIGQPWPDVMQWLAKLSNTSLDWQELPNDYLNLMTDTSYPLDEVHDRINRALHARGFTSIRTDNVLSVFKIEKLDPSMVRQVSEEDLYNFKRYDFAKVSFELPEEMEVEKAKEDVKQLLSPHAKVFPLVTTKRLLVMDTVANLRTVSELLNQERMFQDGRVVPTEFVLTYARPEQVIEILYVILGVDPEAKPAQTDPKQQAQMMQQLQQMQQQGRNVKMPMPQQGPSVYLAYNRRRNSILANAPPAEMKKIKQAIEYLDVPFRSGDGGDIAETDTGRTLFKYRLVTMDPEQLKLTLEEIGELDPRTELRADPKSKILFARATAADHKKIAALKDELDGTGRGLHQIWLPRRLPADAVAGTIKALMAGQEEEEDDDDRGGYYSWYSYRGRDNKDEPKKGFRVDADIENNRLLLWASEAEYQEVEKFVAELSKRSPAMEAQRTVRTLGEANDPEQTARLLEQLRQVWPALGDNELIINDNRPKADAAQPKKKATEDSASSPKDREADGRRGVRFQLAQLTEDPPAEDAPEERSPVEEDAEDVVEDEEEGRPPVTITITEDGRILVASEDTEALDRLEQFIGQAAPQPQRYRIFHIKHADVYDVYLNLTEFYEEELKGDTKQVWNSWWDTYDEVKSDEGSLLSKRPTLRFIWDPASDTILVANASPGQLAEIERLINEYDQPKPDDQTTERVTRPVKIRYSRASTIVGSLKEVFRDLLSSKDKEFDSKDQRPGTERSGVTILRFSPGGNSDEGKRSAPVKVGFQGALSLGADDVSNIVLVSAQKEVFELVEAMIAKLDAEAAPQTTLHVHRVNGSIKAEALQKALNQAVGKEWLGNRPEQTGTAAQAEQREGEGQGDRDRGRDRGDRRRGRNND